MSADSIPFLVVVLVVSVLRVRRDVHGGRAVGGRSPDAGLSMGLWGAGGALVPHAAPIAVACAGVLIGTLLGERILLGLRAERFRKTVAVLIGLLGVWLLR